MIEGALLLFPFIVGVLYMEQKSVWYLLVAVICIVLGVLGTRHKPKNAMFYFKEGCLATAASWITLSIFGSLPLILTGEYPSYVDALFEIVSGFTTTGATVLSDVECLCHATLFWRAFTHWIGGMGVLVFLLAIIPLSGGSNFNLMRAESPGPSVGKLVPKIRTTARLLYLIYLALTVMEFVFLVAGRMPVYDAICTSIGTAGTGGFGIKADSMGGYSAYIQWVVTIFMILFGVNFNAYYFILYKKVKKALKLEEVRYYFLIILVATGIIFMNLLQTSMGIWDSLRHAAFQVATIITTTGYSSCDYSVWPQFSKMILFLLTVCGASAGSTGGGVKISRLLIIVKKIKLDIQKLLHPQKVEAITMDGKVVDTEVVNQIMAYFCSFIIIVGILFFLISFNNFDFETTITSVITCIGNVGPGYGLCGPMGNFSMFSDFSKIVLSFAMLIGRLEIYPIIIFLAPVLGVRKVSKSFHTRNKRKI